MISMGTSVLGRVLLTVLEISIGERKGRKSSNTRMNGACLYFQKVIAVSKGEGGGVKP